MADTKSEPYVLAAVADLIFGSRIRAAAARAGVPVRFARTMDELREAGAGARLVLLDLDTRWLDASSGIAALLALDPAPRIVAFVSHVRTDAMEEARAAGAHRVMPRSAFVRELPALLGG
jgi:DNA-binding NarL/FixJ family response regulator